MAILEPTGVIIWGGTLDLDQTAVGLPWAITQCRDLDEAQTRIIRLRFSYLCNGARAINSVKHLQYISKRTRVHSVPHGPSVMMDQSFRFSQFKQITSRVRNVSIVVPPFLALRAMFDLGYW